MFVLLGFFSLSSELPKFKPRGSTEGGLLSWFGSLDDLRMALSLGAFTTPENISIGKLINSIIFNSESFPYIPAILQEYVNEMTGDNKSLPSLPTFEPLPTIEEQLKSAFALYWWIDGLLYMGDKTGIFMTFNDYATLFQGVNSLLTTAIPITAIFIISFIFFFCQLAFCFCCCKPNKSRKRGSCCQQTCHGILQVIFIFSFVFLAIGTSKLAIFRQDIYKLTDYLPEITIPVMESIENAVEQAKVEISSVTGESYNSATMLNQTLHDYYTPIDEAITNIVNMNYTASKEVETINKKWKEIDNGQSDILVSEEEYGKFVKSLNDSNEMFNSNRESLISSINQLIGIIEMIHNLGYADKLDFGVHTLQYYIDMSKTDNYTSSNVLDRVLTRENIGALSLFFSDYIFLQLIVIFFAALILIMMVMFGITIYTNTKISRCCASSSSLTPCFLSIILFVIGAVATFLGSALYIWPKSMNDDICKTVNGVIYRSGLSNLRIPRIDITEITKNFIQFGVNLQTIYINEIEKGISDAFWSLDDNVSLYEALELSSQSNINGDLVTMWNYQFSLCTKNMTINTKVFTDISNQIKELKQKWTKEGYYMFTTVTEEQLTTLKESEMDYSKKALYEEIIYMMKSETAVGISNAVMGLDDTDMSSTFEGQTKTLFQNLSTTVAQIINALRIILSNFQIKPLKGLGNTFYNEIAIVLTEALAYISIAAHIYIPASVIMVFVLLRRRRQLQPPFVSTSLKMTLPKRQRRSHNDKENEEDIHFSYEFRNSLQYRTSLLEGNSLLPVHAGRVDDSDDSDLDLSSSG